MIVNLVAEGYTEEAVASRLLPFCGHKLGYNYGKRGHNYIRQAAMGFRHLATEHTGVLVLSDFRDTRADCVPEALEEYLLCSGHRVWNAVFADYDQFDAVATKQRYLTDTTRIAGLPLPHAAAVPGSPIAAGPRTLPPRLRSTS